MSTLPPPPGAPQAQPPAPYGQPSGQLPQGGPAPQQFGYAPQQRQGGGLGELFSLNFGTSAAAAKARTRYLWVLIAVAAASVHSLVTGIQIAVNYFKLSGSSYSSSGASTVWGIYALFATLIGVVVISFGVLSLARTVFEHSVERSERG